MDDGEKGIVSFTERVDIDSDKIKDMFEFLVEYEGKMVTLGYS